MLAQYISHLTTRRILLASSSPRRKKILTDLGIIFEVYPSNFAENLDFNSFHTPEEFVMETAKQKALDVAKDVEIKEKMLLPHLIISADTIVVLNKEMIGKPCHFDDAKTILEKLSGQIHSVFTGVAFILYNKLNPHKYDIKTFYEETKVKMAPLTADMIESYVKTGEPMDKAGAYAIQGLGSTFIESINGDFYNVIGLPVFKVSKELCNLINQDIL